MATVANNQVTLTNLHREQTFYNFDENTTVADIARMHAIFKEVTTDCVRFLQNHKQLPHDTTKIADLADKNIWVLVKAKPRNPVENADSKLN